MRVQGVLELRDKRHLETAARILRAPPIPQDKPRDRKSRGGVDSRNADELLKILRSSILTVKLRLAVKS